MSINQLFLQREFFRNLERSFATRSEMVAAIEADLQLGRNAVYRRMKGDTTLAAGEMLQLARSYNIDLNFVKDNPLRTAAYRPVAPAGVTSEVDFFRAVQRSLQNLKAWRQPSFRYVTPELPLAYEMIFPTLRALKIYFYGLTTWRLEKWRSVPFSLKLIHPEANEIADEFVNMAFQLSGTECLMPTLFDVTIGQIHYLIEIGRLWEKELVQTVFQELTQLNDHLADMSRSRRRYAPGETPAAYHPAGSIYQNEIVSTTNLLFLASCEQQMLVTSPINPNYELTIDAKVYQAADQWYDALLEQGTLLGEGAAKQTAQFFQASQLRIEQGRKKACALLQQTTLH